MKLLKLLAKQLKTWPNEAIEIAQDQDSCAHPYAPSVGKYTQGEWRGAVWASSYKVDMPILASDYRTAIVTEEMWKAKREKRAERKAFKKAGWSKHKGGECPVDTGTRVDVIHRDGSEWHKEPAQEGGHAAVWIRHGGPWAGDIIAWRLTPVKEKTPCEELGYKVGDNFTLSRGCYEAKAGQTLTLFKDDGSIDPLFSTTPCEFDLCAGASGAYFLLGDVEKQDPKQEGTTA